ncbi:MAG: putative quinol monooxygenase [Acidimicrobiia bacterium]
MADERILYARFTAKEGKGAELAEILSELIDIVQREEGARYYALHRGVELTDVVWFYEVYADQAALDAHGKYPEFGAVFARIAELTAGPPELIRSEFVASFNRL